MKKLFTLIIFSLLIILAYGKQVDENTAKTVGQAFLANNRTSGFLKSAPVLQLVYKVGSKVTNASSATQPSTFFYVYNAAQSGFVIIAGDDNVTPVLGYSDQGTFDPDHLPQNVAKWMEGYKSEIRYIIDNNIAASPEISSQWQRLKSKGSLASSSTSTTAVTPLMQTKWNQLPYYNALCPGGSVTGCVATAMAQIMKYWSYPATGSGFHSYNHSTYGTLSANFGSTTYQWSSMPASVSSSNNAVATLMYQVGVSVDMDYSPESSGAYVISVQSPVTNCAEYALKTYFGYKTSLKGVQRSNYSQTQWIDLLKTELDASRPVLYAGFGSGGGHCFVADGYDNNNYIHFNWGWGGAYDGYFQINALNPSGTGTGGGTGGFNSGHQAVIGIEPPSAIQTYNMALYDNLTPSASSITYGQDFTVSTNIVNLGTSTFTGDYGVAVFDKDLNFIDFMETKTGYTLQSNYAYSNNLVFSTTGLLSMLPGKYYVALFFLPSGGNWQLVSDNGSYTNLTQITVSNTNNIELYSAMVLSPGTTLTKGSPASVKLNILNNGAGTFIGEYAVDLYNLDGSWAQSVGSITESDGLPAGYTYVSPYLTFTTNEITVEPGTYLVAVEHNPYSTGWELTGSSYFQNPIKVTVVAPSIQPDVYEDNNSVEQAYNLSVAFLGNGATCNTSGSSCHITSDNDYYKIVVPAGYNYTFTPRLRDSYNSGNGITYTLDGLFSYSTDGTTWSDAFDDVISGNIALNGGGTVYFHVAPYFAGETGTYLFDVALTRLSTVGLADLEPEAIKVYPNPVSDFIFVDLNGYNGTIKQIWMVNGLSQVVYSTNIVADPILTIPVKGLSSGIYSLQFETNLGLLTKKIVVRK
jgi:hypothetical protein